MGLLKLWCNCLDESHSFLPTTLNVIVELLRISSESCKRVNVAVLVLFLALTQVKICVIIRLCSLFIFVENFDLVPI